MPLPRPVSNRIGGPSTSGRQQQLLLDRLSHVAAVSGGSRVAVAHHGLPHRVAGGFTPGVSNDTARPRVAYRPMHCSASSVLVNHVGPDATNGGLRGANGPEHESLLARTRAGSCCSRPA
jgi:hypothetical protein